jgi:1-acyl-sn-glycerol-3-phosphate acyltransferase
MSPWAHLKSATSFCVITLNLLLCALPLFIAGIVKGVVPSARPAANRLMDGIYRWAVRVDDFWLRSVVGIRWNQPALNLKPDGTYIVLANHTSWSDILLIQSVIVGGEAGPGPLLKFLVKRELAFIPILGLVFWAYDFPLLRRTSRAGEDDATRRQRDLQAVRDACQAVRESPAAMMNFAEGTRSTPEKRASQESPYQFLLAPRVGGFHALVEGVGDEIEGVIDLTLGYPAPVSFWAFLSGGFPPVQIGAVLFERGDLPGSREEAALWLSARWDEKDRRIAAIRAEAEGNPIPS